MHGATRNSYNILAGEPQRKMSLGTSRHKSKDNVKMAENMKQIELAEDKLQWYGLMMVVINVQVDKLNDNQPLKDHPVPQRELLSKHYQN
jgi:hypothetical protein